MKNQIYILRHENGLFDVKLNNEREQKNVSAAVVLAALAKLGGLVGLPIVGVHVLPAANVQVQRDGAAWIVVHTIGHEQRRYKFYDLGRAESFANDLRTGTYPATQQRLSGSKAATFANEGAVCFMLGPTIPLRHFPD